jgi:hypothetical protein
MTPTTIIATIAYQDFTSTPTTAAGVASSTPVGAAAEHVRHARSAEVFAWLTQRLDWEDQLDRLRNANGGGADVERG